MKLTIKNPKKLTLFLLGLIAFLFLSWSGYKLALTKAKYLPLSSRQFLAQAHFQAKEVTANLADAFHLKTYLHPYSRKKLKQLNLLMSRADINNLQADAKKSLEIGYHDKQTANTQQITLVYDQTQIPTRISFHGGGANNYIFNKTDYNLKLLDNHSINNINNFNLFNSSIHNWLTPLLANNLAKNLNLRFNNQEPVTVKLNNKYHGIYILEEKINQGFLNRRGLTQAKIIKLKDETRLPHRINPVALNAHHLSGFDFSIANVDPIDDPIVLYQLDQFFKAIQSQNIDQIIKFVNLDYLARYDAYREFLGINHDAAGDNQIFYYQPQDQKFYPVVRNEGDLNRLQRQGGTTLKSYNSYNSHLEDQYDYPRLFLLLHHNSQFRQLKYKYLYQLVSQYPQLKTEFNNLYDQYADIFIYDTSDEASVRNKKKLFKNYLNIIDHNYNLIKQQLEFNQLAVSLINQPGQVTIEIIPDAVVPIEITSFQLEFDNLPPINIADTVNQEIIIAKFSHDYDLLPTIYSYTIDAPAPVTSVIVKAKNQTTAQPIKSIHTAIATKE